MKIKVVTNNPKVNKYSLEEGFDAIFLNCSSQKVLHYARDLILNGWCLAADPLAGYISRYNPYHTVFLQESFNNKSIGKDILRLEKAACHLENPNRPKEIDEKTKSDYCYMDFSIATSTMGGLIKNMKYLEPKTYP